MKKLIDLSTAHTSFFLFLALTIASEVALYGQGCLNPSASGAQFQMSLLSPQTGTFTFEADVTPQASGSSIDGGVSLALGRLGAFTDMVATVRFNPSGKIDMRKWRRVPSGQHNRVFSEPAGSHCYEC
jgi:hypothetical protein